MQGLLDGNVRISDRREGPECPQTKKMPAMASATSESPAAQQNGFLFTTGDEI
ncbi:hypothetical protein [Paenirhodobacter populi]|uniref:hypothetical protein n=1 Tax=Paenirhodobacter populi TaxID=2306993 RepID=UPI0013E3871C|nr:hypothetical protein [Sinirhodobacter populi]